MPRPTASLFAVAARRHHADAADADLLARWATARDADAFAELVRRYGPLVWRTCRANAGEASAEDAFQATFLALARRAGSVRPGAVAGWLHRTAGRAAAKARRRDRRPLPPTSATASPDPLDRLTARELLAAVDAELLRLPDRYRLPLLLCGVDGLSQDEAAARLGWSAGSVKGRLERGRATLRRRLAARGLAVPAVVGVAAVPDRLLAAVVAAAGGGPVPAGVAELVPGGLTVKLTLGGAVLAAGLLAGGLGWAGGPPGDKPTVPPPAADKSPGGPLVWSWTNRDPAGKLNGMIDSGVWLPDGTRVLAGVATWDAAAQTFSEVLQEFDASTGAAGRAYRGTCLRYWVYGQAVAVSPGGDAVAAIGFRAADGKFSTAAVDVWATGGTAPRLTLPVPDIGYEVRFAADGKTLAAVGRRYGPIVWDVATGREVYRHATPGRPNALAALPAGRWVVGDVDGRVRLIDPATAAETELGTVGTGEVFAAVTAGDTLAAGGGATTIWATAADRSGLRLTAPRTVGGPAGGVLGLSLDPKGRYLAASCTDGSVRLYAVADGRPLLAHPIHKQSATSVAFSPDGRRLLTTGGDRVAVWDVAALLAGR